DHDHGEFVADVRLMRGGVVRGTVRDDRGAPLGTASVLLYQSLGKGGVGKRLVTNPFGPSIGGYDAGFQCGESFRIECAVPCFGPVPKAKLELAPGENETRADFRLVRKPGSVVRGRVVDPAGRPVKFEALLESRFPTSSPNARAWKLALWAIAEGAQAKAPG